MTSFRRAPDASSAWRSPGSRGISSTDSTPFRPTMAGDAETKAVQPVLALEQNGDGEHGPLIPDDALGNAGHSHSDPIVGGPLAADDLIGAVPHLAVDAVQPGPVRTAPQLAEAVQVDAGDIGAAPHRQLTVPVLAENGGVDVAAVHAQLLSQQIFQAGGIQHCAGAEYPAG